MDEDYEFKVEPIVGYYDIERTHRGTRITLVVERGDGEYLDGDTAKEMLLQFLENNGDNLEDLLRSEPSENEKLN